MPFTLPFSKVVCPFCFHEFRIGHAPFRVYSDPNRVQDPKVLEFLNLTGVRMPMPPVEEIQGFWRKLIGLVYYPKMRDKNRIVKNRICPSCHMTLPTQLANNGKKGDVIAVVGYRNTGKSNFFGVLIPSLRNRYAREVGLSLHALDSFDVTDGRMCSSDTLYDKRYGSSLQAKEPKAVPATPSAQTNQDIRIPMIYRLNMKKFTMCQRILHPFSHHRPLDLVLFDAAGEDLDSAEVQRIHARYLSRAAGIIMLLDPLSYESIRRDLRPDINDSTLAKRFDTFKSITDAMANYNPHYHEGRQVKTPLAVVLSKFDELRPNGQPLEGLDPSVFHDHVHSSGFDKRVVDETSEHLYKFLDQRNINSVLASLDEYSTWKLFGMAALGHPPMRDNRLTTIEPINIADPLLWILYKLGHIAAKKER